MIKTYPRKFARSTSLLYSVNQNAERRIMKGGGGQERPTLPLPVILNDRINIDLFVFVRG